MKLAVFGSTGKTGQLLVRQALEAGYQVTALARTPAKLAIRHESLRVIEGDVTDASSVEDAIAGSDAVLSVLGPTSNRPEFLVSQGMELIIAAMNRHGVGRLVVSAGAAIADPNDTPTLLNKLIGFMVRRFSRYVYLDMVRTVEAVRASDLEWTIVRVPMLVDGTPAGHVNVGYVGKDMGRQITRADLAAFMLKQASDLTYLHQAPAISN